MESNGNVTQHENVNIAPKRLSYVHSPILEFGKDMLSARYMETNSSLEDDFGIIRSDNPFPSNVPMGYFEVTVVNCSIDNSIIVGLTSIDFPTNHSIGSAAESYGYLGGSGYKVEADNTLPYSTPFTGSDTIGCGMWYSKHEIFFTKNGKYLGPAFHATGSFFPTVCLHYPGEEISINFGQKPFVFQDIEKMMEAQEETLLNELDSINCNYHDITMLVRDFFNHYGYGNSLEILDKSIGIKEEKKTKFLEKRYQIRTLIFNGNILEATEMIRSNFPQLTTQKKYSYSVFVLHCQNLIELIKERQPVEALKFAQNELPKFNNLSKKEIEYLQQVLGLLAYQDPLNSPLAHLIQSGQREFVADEINRAILDLAGEKTESKMETLLKQLVLCQEVVREQRDNKGEYFNLSLYT